ncbi:MAG: hypothetical protein LBL28_04475 [Treponema sp.]|nr:hypothetical protein [Treponema sp.]
MKTKKNVLIVTDGAASTRELAEQVAGELKEYQVLVRVASDFAGTDILPVEAFFLGCEEPAPPSFAYLAELLQHINLAGRPCGVFSPGSEKAAKYLADLVHNCEAAAGKPFVAADNKAGLGQWIRTIL